MSMRRKLVLSIVSLAIAILLSLVFYKDIGTAYVAHAFNMAANGDAELDAARLMNHWAHRWSHGYSVEAKDVSGNNIRPWESGDYDAVTAVEVTWNDGSRVYRTIQNRNTLSYLFGE
jgi:hypothetical protein